MEIIASNTKHFKRPIILSLWDIYVFIMVYKRRYSVEYNMKYKAMQKQIKKTAKRSKRHAEAKIATRRAKLEQEHKCKLVENGWES